jgi:hypothetical protein
MLTKTNSWVDFLQRTIRFWGNPQSITCYTDRWLLGRFSRSTKLSVSIFTVKITAVGVAEEVTKRIFRTH